MDDLIKRQDAIDACFNGKCANIYDCKEAIEKIPSAQKTGHWIYKNGAMVSPWYSSYECSECGCLSGCFKYCPECGSRNRGKEE